MLSIPLGEKNIKGKTDGRLRVGRWTVEGRTMDGWGSDDGHCPMPYALVNFGIVS